MRTQRALVAGNPLHFGRGPAWLAGLADERGWAPSEELRLFATAFAAGFMFVSILIA